MAGTVALLLLAVTNETWEMGAFSLVLFGLFAARVRSAANPFIQPGLLRNRRYSVGLIIVFLAGGVAYSLPFLSPLLLSNVNALGTGWIGFVMLPATMMQAVMSRRGGKLADARGNPALFYTASSLLLACFALLSSFAGVSPTFIAGILIFGHVGQAFMQIALSNTISQTLPKEEIGVGMGLVTLLNFIGGDVSASIYNKMVDLGSVFHWNPLNRHDHAIVYSNIYLILALLYVGILVLYHFQFGKARARARRGELIEARGR